MIFADTSATSPFMKGNDDLRRLGIDLRMIREAAGLTQVQLASLLDSSQPTISVAERGSGATTTDILLRWVSVCRARLVVVPEREDLLAGIDHDEGKELLSLWRKAPKDLRVAILGMLRQLTPRGEA